MPNSSHPTSARPRSERGGAAAVARALEHYESVRRRHELEMRNSRLVARLDEIRELASLDQ